MSEASSPGTLCTAPAAAGAALPGHDRALAGRLLAGGTGTWALSKLAKQMVRWHKPGGEQFGQERLIEFTERAGRTDEGVQEMVRNLSRSLVQARGGVTTDDATLPGGMAG